MRFWFGRKSAAADVRPCVPAWLGGEGRGGFARDYHAQFEEVFRRNPVGQRAVRLVAGMLGALPVYASEGDERAAAIVSAGEVRTIASAAGEAVIGTALNVLADGPSIGFDEVGFLDVELADGEHWLESRDDAALGNGANLAAIGSEVIQFGRAIPTGERQFRLERLLRGRFGTEWAVASHGPNEKFVLIRPGTLQEIALPPSAIGASISIRPRGLADDDSQPIEGVVTGEAMRPPSPVDLQAEVQVDGALSLAWTRRSRLGWAWPGADPPLGESAERYRLSVQGAAATLSLTANEPRALISAESLNGMTGSVTVTVVQIGDFAESRPLTATITL